MASLARDGTPAGGIPSRLGWPGADPAASGEPRLHALGWPGGSADGERDPRSAQPPGEPSEQTRVRPATWSTAGQVADTAETAAVRSLDRATPLAHETEQEMRLVRLHRERGPLQPPTRTRVIVVANQKGGVGKTTTAVNIAAGLSQLGQQVLLVDLDPQGNASTALGIEHAEGTPGAYQALIDDRPVAELVRPSPLLPGLSVLPASIDLAGAEIDLVSLDARESRLRGALAPYVTARHGEGQRLDYVFIDCPPSLGLLTLNALVAAEEILVPIQCEYYALEGVGQLMRTVDMVRGHLNPALVVSSILLTMHDARTRLSAGVADEVRRHFPNEVLRVAVPRSVRISEAPSYQQTVITYDPSSPGALTYLEAAREISARGAVDLVQSAPEPAGAAGEGVVVARGPTRAQAGVGATPGGLE